MTLRILRTANHEVAELIRYYEQIRPGLGGEFADALAMAYEAIELNPDRFTPIEPVFRVMTCDSSCSTNSRIASSMRSAKMNSSASPSLTTTENRAIGCHGLWGDLAADSTARGRSQ
jgi:hypothetical protein